MKFTTKDLSYNGVIAAVYIALTLALAPISYGAIQFRFAEIMVLLVFFNKKYTFGICLGTAIANLGSSLSMWDCLFGTLATLISCIAIMFSKHLLVALIYPVIANALVIGFMIYWLGGFGSFMLFLIPCLQVAFGECVVLLAGYGLFMALRRRKDFKEIINGNQNLDFKW